jgi:catechol 2,3-dioxygenase-like lactoylglutathione lyase family enzyme
MGKQYDRSAEDVANIVGLEHVNLTVPDQRLATQFYITGMVFTRDPYLVTGVTNMWVNVGRSQFHLPTRGVQVLRGHVGLVLPDLDALRRRLEAVRGELAETRFAVAAGESRIDVTCPWGNTLRCHAPDPRFGPIVLGMPYVAFDVGTGAAEGIARFYREILKARATTEEVDDAPAARVSVGHRQHLVFRETPTPLSDYDGHHIQVYVADFSGPHEALRKRGLITEESNQHQYRFVDIVDPAGGDMLYTLEHEIRAMSHPLFGRPMINRNPAQTNNSFTPGYDDQPWAYKPE